MTCTAASTTAADTARGCRAGFLHNQSIQAGNRLAYMGDIAVAVWKAIVNRPEAKSGTVDWHRTIQIQHFRCGCDSTRCGCTAKITTQSTPAPNECKYNSTSTPHMHDDICTEEWDHTSAQDVPQRGSAELHCLVVLAEITVVRSFTQHLVVRSHHYIVYQMKL
jgi:hypothetical protein